MALDGARLFHVNVNCTDLACAQRFYIDALGLALGVRTTPAEAQPGTAFGLDQVQWDAAILVGAAGFDGAAVDLLEWLTPPPTGLASRSLDRPGFQRIGVTVPDLDATLSTVESAGGSRWGDPVVHDHGGGEVRLAMVSDPDGTTVEVMQGTEPRLRFVGVTCTDLERSVEFYGRLGFTAARRFHSQGDDGAHLRLAGPYAMEEVVLVAPGGGELLLILTVFEPPHRREPTPPRPLNALGIARMAALVPDLAAVDGAGLDPDVLPLSPPAPMNMGPGLPDLSVMCFRGPDGEVVELIEDPTG
jgi:catechol 2,3-dioxygenase-like lactoylglutathione lyase family enzyme